MIQYVASKFREAEFVEFDYSENYNKTFNFIDNEEVYEDEEELINYKREQQLINFVMYNRVINEYMVELGDPIRNRSILIDILNKTIDNIEEVAVNTYYDCQFMKYRFQNMESFLFKKSMQLLNRTTLKLMYFDYRIQKALKKYFD
jgi:hypothetical protein